jgi:AsmA protein
METTMKRKLWGIGGVAALLVLAAGILVLTFDIDTHKTRIEAAASEAMGMKVSILGTVRLELFPRASIFLENLFIQNRGAAVLSAPLLVARIRFLPLLKGEVRMREVVVNAPKLFITRDAAGRFNLEAREKNPLGWKSSAMFLDVGRILITKGYVLYRDEAANRKIEANECSFTVRNLFSAGGGATSGPSFEGDFSCRDAGTERLRVSDVRAVVKANGGKLEANPVTMKIFGGDGRGSVLRVMKGEHAEYVLDLAITRLRFEEVLWTFHQKKNVVGALDLESHLTMQGANAEEMTRTAQGRVSLRGRNLLLENLDVDLLLEKVARSQHFNLVDLAAFLFVGPLGTLLTKAIDFGSILQEIPGAKSEIRVLVSDWEVRSGVAEAHDVAFTTSKNRFALAGKLDFVHNRFEDLSVAVLNAKGCAMSSQRIHGDFTNPQIDPPIPPLSVLGPFFSLLKKPFEMLQGGECKVYYRGSVEQP